MPKNIKFLVKMFLILLFLISSNYFFIKLIELKHLNLTLKKDLYVKSFSIKIYKRYKFYKNAVNVESFLKFFPPENLVELIKLKNKYLEELDFLDEVIKNEMSFCLLNKSDYCYFFVEEIIKEKRMLKLYITKIYEKLDLY